MSNEESTSNKKNMKHPCDMVQDLLPLAHDGICSASSQAIVNEHLAECGTCREVMEQLNDETVDLRLQQERQSVVGHHAKKVKQHSTLAGAITAGIFAIPILVCLIVNLATSHALDWFFIVLASMGVLSSLTIVPMLVPEKKFLWTAGGFTVALHMLYAVCCLYTSGSWFWVTSAATLLGLSVIILPIAIHLLPLKGALSRHKGLLVMGINTFLLYALLVIIGAHISGMTVVDGWQVNMPEYFRNALLIPLVCLPLPWGIFLTCRYAPLTKRGKWGVCLVLFAVFTAVINSVIDWILGGAPRLRILDADLFHWTAKNLSSNIDLTILLSLIVIGIVLFIFKGRRKSQ